jgi:hypothetical protein
LIATLFSIQKHTIVFITQISLLFQILWIPSRVRVILTTIINSQIFLKYLGILCSVHFIWILSRLIFNKSRLCRFCRRCLKTLNKWIWTILIVSWVNTTTTTLRKYRISSIWCLRFIVLLENQIVILWCPRSLLTATTGYWLWLEVLFCRWALLILLSCWLLRYHNLWWGNSSLRLRSRSTMETNNKVEWIGKVLD